MSHPVDAIDLNCHAFTAIFVGPLIFEATHGFYQGETLNYPWFNSSYTLLEVDLNNAPCEITLNGLMSLNKGYYYVRPNYPAILC
jgi:hypothetical protein